MQAISVHSRRLCPGSKTLTAMILMVCVVAAAEALGCPNCKDAVNTADPEGLNVARGYFYSILIMLAMPFTLVGSFGIYVWREIRRQRMAAPQQPDGQPLNADRIDVSHSQTAALP